MRYTAWGIDGYASILITGDGPPAFEDGTLMEPDAELIWVIEADSWEEAMTKYHDLQGWEPYKAMDASEPDTGG